MTTHVEESANISKAAVIGFNCVIMDEVEIGDRTEVGHNVIIYPGTKIGKDVFIGDNSVLGRQPRAGSTSRRKIKQHPPLAIEDGAVLGTGVVVYAGTSIRKGALVADLSSVRENVGIGEGARIGRECTIECNARIGKNASMQCGCHITVGCIIEEDVFLGCDVTTMNDKFMSRRPDLPQSGPIIRKGASIGSNATLLPGVEIGEGAVVGAGAVVPRNVESSTTVIGNPAHELHREPSANDSH